MTSLGLIADAVLKGTVLLVLVFGLAYVFRRAPAAARHLIWAVGLVGVLALPLLSKALPWRLQVLPPSSVSATTSFDVTPREVALNDAASPAIAEPRVDLERSSTAAQPASGLGAQFPATSPAEGGGLSLPSGTTLLLLIPILWLVGVSVLLVRLGMGVAAIQWLARSAAPLRAPKWTQALARAKRELGIDRSVRLVVSDTAPMPFTAGVARPIVVLPATADDWVADRLHAVLLHELAHIRRRDVLAHLVSQAACAAYWFHPMVWMAARRLRAECEHACDDLVLGAGTRASDYAEHLLSIVRSAAQRWTPAVALPMARRTEFEGRLLAILESTGMPRAVPPVAAASIVGFVGLVVLPLAALAPSHVSDPPPTVTGPAIYAQAPVVSSIGGVDPAAPGPTEPTSTDLPAAPSGGGDAPAIFADEAPALELTPVPAARSAAQSSMSPVAALVRTLSDENAGVRTEAARALAGYQDTTAIRALSRALAQDEDPSVRRTAAWALGEMENPLAIPALSRALASDADPAVRVMAASALGEIDDASAIGALAQALETDAAPSVRAAAIDALGEIDDPRAIAPLRPALSDSSIEIRGKAIRALGEIDDARAVDLLTPILAGDANPRIRQLAAWALGEIEDARAVEPLIAALGDADRAVRVQTIRALAEIEDPRSVPPLIGLLTNEDIETRKYAVYALGEIEDARAVDGLSRVLRNDADPEVRAQAASALGNIETRSTVPALAAALSDANVEVRRRAASALGDVDNLTTAPPELIRAVQDSDPEVRLRAVSSLGDIEDPAAVPALRQLLQDEVTAVRRAAIRALGEIHDPASYEVLVAALQDEDPEVRRLAARALGRRN